MGDQPVLETEKWICSGREEAAVYAIDQHNAAVANGHGSCVFKPSADCILLSAAGFLYAFIHHWQQTDGKAGIRNK